MIWRQWRGFVSKLLQFKAFLSIFLKPIFGSFVNLLGNVKILADFIVSFRVVLRLRLETWVVSLPSPSRTGEGSLTMFAFEKVWYVWCLKKMRTRKKRKKRKEEIRMKDERVVCSLKLCSFLARGQSNWTRDESHACCRPQRMCNAQSLSCLLLLAHVLSSTGVTRFNAFLQNLGYHEPFALSFYFLLVRRRSRTQACHKWLRCGTFSMCGGLRANWYIIKMYNIWIYSNMRKG